MGGLCTSANTRSDKKVVIVGASFAGLSLAEKLWDHFDVLLVDKSDFFEFVCANPRTLVQDDIANEITIGYNQILRAHAQKAEFMQGTLEQVDSSSNSIQIRIQSSGELENIDYDYLVICTGSRQQEPIREQEIVTIEERKSKLALEKEAIKRADSVLVVGAGAVGVEVMGELIHQYSQKDKDGAITLNKKLGIVSRNGALLPYYSQKVQDIALAYMRKHGVELHLNTEYNEKFREQNKFDHVIQCLGPTFKSDFIKKTPEMQDCVNAKGQIFVNDHLQVTNVDPSQQAQNFNHSTSEHVEELYKEKSKVQYPKIFNNIYCIGDACLTRLNEEKSIYPIKKCAQVCADNIIATTQGRDKLQSIPNAFPGLYVISLGPEYGIMIINDLVSEGRQAGKIKAKTFQDSLRSYKGNQVAKRSQKRQQTQLECLLCCCNPNLCCCCPCPTKVRQSRRDQ